MKTTEAESRIQGVNLTAVSLAVGDAGDMSMKVVADLVATNGEVHGKTERVGGWSEEVIQAVGTLTAALEGHLLAVNFKTGESDDRSAERDTPAGIIEARVGRP